MDSKDDKNKPTAAQEIPDKDKMPADNQANDVEKKASTTAAEKTEDKATDTEVDKKADNGTATDGANVAVVASTDVANIADEKPAKDKLAEEKSVEGKPVVDKPIEGTDKTSSVESSLPSAANKAETTPAADSSPTDSSPAEKTPAATEAVKAESAKEPAKTDPIKPVKNEPPIKETPKKEPAKKEPAATKQKQGGGLLKLIVVIILLGGIGLGGYWLYLQEGKSSSLAQTMEQQQSAIESLERKLDEEKQQRQRQQVEREQLLADLHSRVNSQSKRLRELSTTTRDDWLLAEAEYLMRLANQRLLTERNTKNATALLETADQILRDLDDVDLFPVRKTLASDITALRMASDIDREGLYLRLNAISEAVADLPLLLVNPAGEREAVTDVADPAEATGWRDTLIASMKNFGHQLTSLVRVQRREGGVEPLPSLEEEQYIRHNLLLMLEQAQLALLREEPEVYRTSLVKAQNWITEYFGLNAQSAILVEQLEAASTEPVVQVLPDVSASLEGLRVFIDSWHKRYSVEAEKTSEQAETAQ